VPAIPAASLTVFSSMSVPIARHLSSRERASLIPPSAILAIRLAAFEVRLTFSFSATYISLAVMSSGAILLKSNL
jgi:hypothetical protein